MTQAALNSVSAIRSQQHRSAGETPLVNTICVIIAVVLPASVV